MAHDPPNYFDHTPPPYYIAVNDTNTIMPEFSPKWIRPDIVFEDRSEVNPDGNYAFPSVITKTCLQTVPGALQEPIYSLDTFGPVPCDVAHVPTLVLTPDQRPSLFPPVTPKTASITAGPSGCVPATSGLTNLPSLITVGSTSNTPTADSTTWTRPNGTNAAIARKVISTTRMCFSTSEQALIAFYRTFNYDSCGGLISISGETKVVLSAAELCTPA